VVGRSFPCLRSVTVVSDLGRVLGADESENDPNTMTLMVKGNMMQRRCSTSD